ncbi:MAG: hypothetical protein A2355_16025 [Spirochaetes bacterium RIFOXYB1_FULL_32_8]|nr:MAG: hypothetical protein A2355_16025 [Spirochaetes bacterium RIFOXYB1_FULL_32_8]
MKKLNSAFSLIEIILFTTISTFFMITITFSLFMTLNRYISIKEKSVEIKDFSTVLYAIEKDVLNVNVYPHPPYEEYVYKPDAIIFFSNNQKIEYRINGKQFERVVNEKVVLKTLKIKEFSIQYFNYDDDVVKENQKPAYCIMEFVIDEKNTINFKMRL